MSNFRTIVSRTKVPTISSFDDARAAAAKRLPRVIFDFVDGGAAGETTLRANRRAFEATRFDPRWLSDVSSRDISTTVLGQRVAAPILLAPAGLAALSHPDAELGAARAAGAAGTVFVVSSGSSYSLEEIADVATGPVWFQLYLWRNERVVLDLVRRARESGYGALVLTIDVPVVGNTERNFRNGATLPPGIRLDNAWNTCRHPRWLYRFLTGPAITFGNLRELADGRGAAGIAEFIDRELSDPSATWERLDWLRHVWDGPLVVKGVLSARDAAEAVRRGADAVYVSNHGGRQLDGAPATLEALPAIVEEVGDQVEVFVDGGIRRGEDAVKARALGARACFAGRAWVFALGAQGEQGVRRMLQVMHDDVARTLGLVGVPRFDDVTADVLWTSEGSRRA